MCLKIMLLTGRTSNPLSDNNKVEIHCPNKCGRKYKHRGSVARHLKFECGVTPKFQCTLCTKYFKQRINFKIHMIRIHSCIM